VILRYLVQVYASLEQPGEKRILQIRGKTDPKIDFSNLTFSLAIDITQPDVLLAKDAIYFEE